jgi:hypothetical protein
VTAGQETTTEYEWQTGVGISNGQTTSAGWRQLAPISAIGSFLPHEKALATQKR